MKIVKWVDFIGQQHVFMEGKGDDIFHAIPHKRDEEGNSYTEILSKEAMFELVDELREEQTLDRAELMEDLIDCVLNDEDADDKIAEIREVFRLAQSASK